MPKNRLTLEKVPQFSLFVNRSLQALTKSDDMVTKTKALEGILALDLSCAALEKKLEAAATAEAVNLLLREWRRSLLVQLATRDMMGLASYECVVAAMSDFAQSAVSHVVRVNALELARRYGVPVDSQNRPEDFLVVAMGKLGGAELNVSSDIDLVFLYDEAGQTQATSAFPSPSKTISNQEFFERLAKRVIPALDAIEGAGFVFRVDMRLRPFGDSGPIAMSLEMLEEYLYTEGRDWERFAWLKARIVNCPVFSSSEDFNKDKNDLATLISPFIYRKYVDFSALSALSRVHEMIRAETVRRETGKDEGINVKLGRGGIREIEFIAQTFQVIRGGQDTQFQGRETLKALDVIARKGVLPKETCEKLKDGYLFLRNLEHAIQYVDDKQTHRLALDSIALERIGAMLGLEGEELLSRLSATRDFVAQTFDSIFRVQDVAEEKDGWPVGWRLGDEAGKKMLAEHLKTLGFTDTMPLADRIALIFNRSDRAQKTNLRDEIAKLIVFVAENAATWLQGKTSPNDILTRYLRLIEIVLGRPTYIALLNQYPPVVESVGRLFALSPWASEYLIAHPVLLDELVTHASIKGAPGQTRDWSEWKDALKKTLEGYGGDRERELDTLRDRHHSAIFSLLLEDLNGILKEEELAMSLSSLADAVLDVVLELSWQAVKTRHCEVPRFAIIGFGKLGARELGYASDLDLVFLYEDNAPEALSNYVKLARRILSSLSIQTRAGILFETDTRLRPNGEDGLLVSTVEAFKLYEENADGHGAWLWEHQALSKARFCAGDKAIGEAFEKVREAILRKERDIAATTKEIAAMREKIVMAHAPSNDLFDIKHDWGGMIDVEFVVQRMVLLYSKKHPILTENLGNVALLRAMREKGLLDAAVVNEAIKAYVKLRQLQRLTRLNQGGNENTRVAKKDVMGEREAIARLWKSVFG